MKNAEELFKALVNNNEDAAFETFKAAIGDKLQTALDVKKVAITSTIFNNQD